MSYVWFLIAAIFLWNLADDLPLLAILIAAALGYFKAVAKKTTPAALDEKEQRAYQEITQLALLELELKHSLEDGKINASDHEYWQQSIAVRKQELCDFLWPNENSQLWQLENAWKILEHYSNLELPEPPWHQPPVTVAIKSAAEPIPEAQPLEIREQTVEEPIKQEIIAPDIVIQAAEIPAPVAVVSEQVEISASSTAEEIAAPSFLVETVLTEAAEINPVSEPETIIEPEPVVTLRAFTEPKPPSKLTQLFNKVKNIQFGQILSEIIWPFLWQNIGWFIAGFCIVFGSIYIVAYSSGFIKNLMILLSLSLYSGLLLLCGYQIRLKRPQFYVSSYVSVILAVLLIPLLFTVAANLLIAAETPLQFIVSLIIELILLAASIYSMQLATGLIERDLPKQYNYFFIALAAGHYFSAAIINQHWLFLAVLHFALAAILIYALQLCNKNWLQEIFLDKRRTSYYLVGTLFYAAIVSFIYLTHVSQIKLPNGYYGLCLIIFCSALFYIDRSIQSWLKKPRILNHLSFIIYGLSVLAIFIAAAQNNWNNTAILIITLLFSSALYAAMLWHYVSYPPLYLLLTSSGWLYAGLILSHFSYELYFLLSLPFFYGLKKLYDFALYREAEQLAVICYRFLISGILLLLGFSLYSSQPGIIAMLSPLMAAFVIYKIIPQQIWLESKKLAYFNIALITFSAYYSPLLFFNNSISQFCVLLIVLAGIWLLLALKHKNNSAYLDIFLNSLLVSLFLSIGLASQDQTSYLNIIFNGLLVSLGLRIKLESQVPISVFFPSILITSSIILAITSLTFFIRQLFYIFLILLGTGVIFIKKIYFPVSSGLESIILVSSLYGTLWFFKYYKLHHNIINLPQNTLKILGITTQVFNNKIDTCQRPLELVMYLMWFTGLSKIGSNLFHLLINSQTALLILLSGISTFLIMLYSRKAFLLAFTILLFFVSLASLWVNYDFIKFLNFSAFLILLLWLSGWYLFNFSFRWLQVITLDKQENLTHFQQQLSHTLHYSIFAAALTCFTLLFFVIEQSFITHTAASLLLPFILITLFFISAGYYYQQRLHSYFVISILIIIGLLSYCLLFNFDWFNLFTFNKTEIVLLFVITAITLCSQIIAVYQKTNINFLYCTPLQNIAIITYTAALIIAVLLKIDNFAYQTPFLFLAFLTLPLFPLHSKRQLKGFLIPVLLTLFVLSNFNSYLFMGWSFSLWILGYYLLPYLNKIFKKDIIVSDFSAILGLGLIIINFGLNAVKTSFPNMTVLIIFSTLYSALMLKYPNWLWLRWTTALGISMSTLAVTFKLCSILVNSMEIVFLFLASCSVFLFTIAIRQAFLLSISVVLFLVGINALLPSAESIDYFILTSLFVPVAWFFGWFLFNITPRWLQLLTLQEKEDIIPLQQQLTQSLHHTLFILAAGGIFLFIPGIYTILSNYNFVVLLSLIASTVFFFSAGYYYKQRLHSYFVISILLCISLLNAEILVDIKLEVIFLLIATAVFTTLFNGFDFYPKQSISQLYAKPLQHIAIVLSGLCLILCLFIKTTEITYSVPFFILALLSFPLLKQLDYAAIWRGYLIPILLTLTVLNNFNIYLWAGWSFILWLLDYYGFSYVNKITKKELIAANFSSSLGLLLTILNLGVNLNIDDWQNIPELILFTTVYLCLMLNYAQWQWLRWLTAFGINLTGIVFFINWFSVTNQFMLICAGILIWQNLLLMLVPCWNKYFPTYKQDIYASLDRPLRFWILVLLLLGLLSASVIQIDTVNSSLILMNVGLNISLLHFLWRSPAAWLVNIALYSLLSSWLMFIDNTFNFSLKVIIWTWLLQLSFKFKNRYHQIVYFWFLGSFIIGLGFVLFNFSGRVDWQLISSLVFLNFISYREFNYQNKSWLTTFTILSLILLHSIWLLNHELLSAQLIKTFPYYALQDLILIYFFNGLQNKLEKLTEFTQNLRYWLLILAVGFWFMHAGYLLTENTIVFNINHGVAILDLFLGIGLIIKSYQKELDKLVYYLAVILAILAGYVHLCLFGLSGFNIYDAILLLLMSYLLLPLNYKLDNKALYQLNFFLPLLALFAVSWQASFNNSLLFFVIAVFYLLLPRRQRENSPIFLALTLFNVGVYLWIPYFAKFYHLFSVYTVPASMTILLMLQLHSVELKPSLYHSMRLLSLTALYSGITIDIWLNQEMSLFLFMTILLLSLAGIIVGIGLKIRAFLYCGSLFFIANVIAQLIYITPENHLTKGIFLFILGGVIFALMIWFQMQREEILQRVRIFRADLAHWE